MDSIIDPALLTRIAFYLFAGMAVVSAIFVVAHRNPIVCAVALVTAFLAVAGLYLTLGATFLTAVQILVYAGAIMVLFLFVIMLLNLESDPFEKPHVARLVGGVLAVALMFGLVSILGGTETTGQTIRDGSTEEVGKIFFGEYIFPFEMASLLLLVAMIGAIVIARRQEGEPASLIGQPGAGAEAASTAGTAGNDGPIGSSNRPEDA